MSRSADAARWLRAQPPGALLRDAAALYGISYQAVRQAWRRLFGDESLPRDAARAGATAIVAELVRAGEDLTLPELAAMAGCSKSKAGAISKRIRGVAAAVVSSDDFSC